MYVLGSKRGHLTDDCPREEGRETETAHCEKLNEPTYVEAPVVL